MFVLSFSPYQYLAMYIQFSLIISPRNKIKIKGLKKKTAVPYDI